MRLSRTEGSSVPFYISHILYGDPKPSPANITWHFNNNLLDYHQLKIEIIDYSEYSYTLFLFPHGYQRKHAGVYTAIVSTAAGTANDSFVLDVFSRWNIRFFL